MRYLKETEQRIRGKQKDIKEEGTKVSELGDMVAVGSSSGIGLSGSGRGEFMMCGLLLEACMKLGHSERERKGVYGFGGVW